MNSGLVLDSVEDRVLSCVSEPRGGGRREAEETRDGERWWSAGSLENDLLL